MVVVEDVHWADTSTRELLALLARQQQGDVVLLLTLRTDESPAPAGLTRYLAELVRRGDHRVALQPLSREQQAHQISDILGVPPHRRLLDEVYARAEGNPFFAEEMLALVAAGRRRRCRPPCATCWWPGWKRSRRRPSRCCAPPA